MSEANYEPIEIQRYFRSHTHLPLWEVLDRAGIWQEVGIKVNLILGTAIAHRRPKRRFSRVDSIWFPATISRLTRSSRRENPWCRWPRRPTA